MFKHQKATLGHSYGSLLWCALSFASGSSAAEAYPPLGPGSAAVQVAASVV